MISLAGAKSVSIMAKRAAHSSGSSVLSATVSPDATAGNFITYNKWIDNVTNTNSQTLTRVASKTLSSNTVVLLSMSPEDVPLYIIVGLTRVTDGTNSVWLIVDYGEPDSI